MKRLLSKTATLALFLAGLTLGYKVAVLNDVHVDLSYSSSSCIPRLANSQTNQQIEDNVNTFAQENLEQSFGSSLAPLGRYGCDPPLELTRTFLQKIKLTDPNIDFLLVPGDLVVHGASLDKSDGDYALLKRTI